MKNGTSNGSGESDDTDKERIIHFPTLAERDQLRRKQQAEENKAHKSEEPFFNAGRIPPLTRAVLALFLAVHLFLFFMYSEGDRWLVYNIYGFVPAYYTGATTWHWQAIIAPITHLFIHGSWMHLLFNSVMMAAMGVFMERSFGTRGMAIFFIFSGLCGALLYFLLNPFTIAPVVGASGAISGLFAVTFLNLYQQGRLGAVGKHGPWPLILFWILLISGMGMIEGDIAWQAHLGGFLGGLGLFHALRKNWIRL